MSDDDLKRLESAVPPPGQNQPPLHLWQPELSGDIDIVIRQDGSWWHEGELIRRQGLVRLFASILRREADAEYYLVTPVEKWRVRVDALPLVVVDFDLDAAGTAGQHLFVTTNTGRRYPLGRDYPLFFPEEEGSAPGDIPAIGLDYGLSAQFNRAAWYRLVEASEEEAGVTGVRSGGLFYPLSA